MSFLDALVQAESTGSALGGLVDKAIGVTLGVVTDREDPEALGRVKVATADKGCRVESSWLFRVSPADYLSLPVPQIGTTCAIWFVGGDRHQGLYMPLTNQLNPCKVMDNLTLSVGVITITITPDGNLDISGATGVSINGQQVATVGARDNDTEGNSSDTLTFRGW